jgi:hypothetical protein
MPSFLSFADLIGGMPDTDSIGTHVLNMTNSSCASIGQVLTPSGQAIEYCSQSIECRISVICGAFLFVAEQAKEKHSSYPPIRDGG